MSNLPNLSKLRETITENLRIQKSGATTIPYIDVTHALEDARARQNHVIFGRRGCGKTLLLQDAATSSTAERKTIYLNCEDFKNHSFPNVLIEILNAVFSEMEKRLTGWFGRKKRSKVLIEEIRMQLAQMRSADELRDEKVVSKESEGTKVNVDARIGITTSDEASASLGSGPASVKASSKTQGTSSFGAAFGKESAAVVERSFERTLNKREQLNLLLPRLKKNLSDFFENSSKIKIIFIQIDDFYHLPRAHQPFIMDYIHRLCKDLPLYFKVATLRHASVLYAERGGQPVGAQERHDYQPVDIDFTFQDFPKTEKQVIAIFHEFASLSGVSSADFDGIFKGDGLRRLILAGGGVPRDCLSLFIEALGPVMASSERIGKDDIRQLSFANFERKIEDLKRDSESSEQDHLLKGIYIIRQFCLDSKSSVFFVPDRVIQESDAARDLIFRLLDYRIIHSVGSAFTHKSHSGSYQGFMIDIGCYAHMRKLYGKMHEIDLSAPGAKEEMRSSPILSEEILQKLWKSAPEKIRQIDLTTDNDA